MITQTLVFWADLKIRFFRLSYHATALTRSIQWVGLFLSSQVCQRLSSRSCLSRSHHPLKDHLIRSWTTFGFSSWRSTHEMMTVEINVERQLPCNRFRNGHRCISFWAPIPAVIHNRLILGSFCYWSEFQVAVPLFKLMGWLVLFFYYNSS